jgi:hypothetical protein
MEGEKVIPLYWLAVWSATLFAQTQCDKDSRLPY